MLRISEKLVFQISALLLAAGGVLAFGIAVGESYRWRTGYGKELRTTINSLSTYGEIIPEGRRHEPPEGAERSRLMIHDAEATIGRGYYTIFGYHDDVDGFAIWIYDAKGELLDLRRVDGIGLHEVEDEVSQAPHAMEMLPDGSVVITYDKLGFMARLDACGDAIWVKPGYYHHALDRADDGGLWTWYGEDSPFAEFQYLIKFDPETGEEVKRIGLVEDIIRKSEENARYFLHYQDTEFKSEAPDDVFHPNDIEVLPADLADEFPMFEAGDLLVSLRTPDMVAVLSQGGDVKWARYGPWNKQHDPDFEQGGKISLYNNAFGRERSEILELDPASDEIRPYFDSAGFPFKSDLRGKHQRLPNGNMLLTIPEQGQVLELDPQGKVVLEFNNVLNKAPEWNEDVANAKWYPAGYLAEPPVCTR